MTNYPGEPPQPSDGESNQGQPQDGPANGSTEGPSDTELTQPVGYWERQAAEQERAQQAGQQPAQQPAQPWAQPWAQRPDPTTAYPSQPSSQPYGQAPPAYQQPQPYGGPYDQQYGQGQGYPPASGQSGPQGMAPGYPPYGAFTPPVRDHPQSTTALVLGIVGLVGGLSCGLGFFVSPFAWALGRNASKEIAASRGQIGGEGQARAGMIMGIIGTVLLVLGLLAIALIIVIAIAGSSSTSGSSV